MGNYYLYSSEDCELPYSVDELIAIGELEEPKILLSSTEPRLFQNKDITNIPTSAVMVLRLSLGRLMEGK